MPVDPVTLQVIQARLAGIVQEMQNSLFRTGYSTIIRESQDASCAILNRHGEVVAQHVVLPLHMGAFPACAAGILKNYSADEVSEGDAFITNHPYLGGSPHAPDMAVLSPIFYHGEWVGFAANLAHKSDIGGPVPGSCWSQAREIYQEGLHVPPIKYVQAYKTSKDIEALLGCNSRTPELVVGDLRGQVGAARLGEKRFQEMMQRYGKETILESFEELFDLTEAKVRAEIASWPDGAGEGEDVRKLGAFIIAYSLITWGGMWLFGREIWLRHGEAFTVVFSMFARFAPLARNTRFLVLRPPGAGLLVSEPVSWSTAAVVLVLLGTVTFDGFIATPTWSALYEPYTGLAKARPALAGVFNFYVLATAVFLLFPVLFGGVFLACCRATVALSGRLTASETARYFVLTLLPIAIAYHVAHYLVFFLLSGQYIVPALSDPFGYGWDLFGTASYKPDVGLVGARFAWYTSVVAIVTGHVIAVQLAHRMAVHLFGDGRRMFASELPLLALMVGYTMLSLWIIAQPTVS